MRPSATAFFRLSDLPLMHTSFGAMHAMRTQVTLRPTTPTVKRRLLPL